MSSFKIWKLLWISIKLKMLCFIYSLEKKLSEKSIEKILQNIHFISNIHYFILV
jgi:hypothetical protein